MTLPVINAPEYRLKVPSTDEEIKYRPFLVKEEKLLLMAMEGGEQAEIITTSKQIINNCILSENINAEQLPLFDLQMALLHIRSKSVGEVIEILAKHPNDKNSEGDSCEEATKIKVNLKDIKLTKNDNHSKQFQSQSMYSNHDWSNQIEHHSTVYQTFTVQSNNNKSIITRLYNHES